MEGELRQFGSCTRNKYKIFTLIGGERVYLKKLIFMGYIYRRCDYNPPGLETFLVITTGGRGPIGIRQVEVREAAKYPTMHRADPGQRITWPNTSVVPEVKQLCLKERILA